MRTSFSFPGNPVITSTEGNLTLEDLKIIKTIQNNSKLCVSNPIIISTISNMN
jgi:hypothetical protein